ncbi:uncharacterized protein LOC119690245 [Teleopsis dalmanni]|uniref:uncharacterized protein LOC119690245 n=1 Tax=Teleopsis dalmanni TaxID=139649 RepID=UPI0018CCF80F|nr:uncharacterized protein LOC119690245 [Teleopsis dalmanni]
MGINSAYLLHIMTEIGAPATPVKIAKRIAGKLWNKINTRKLLEDVMLALTRGIIFKYIKTCNGYYYNLDDTRKLMQYLEDEKRNQHKVKRFAKKRKCGEMSSESYRSEFSSPSPVKKCRREYSATTVLGNSSLRISEQSTNLTSSYSLNIIACKKKKSTCGAKVLTAEMAKTNFAYKFDYQLCKNCHKILKESVEDPCTSISNRTGTDSDSDYSVSAKNNVDGPSDNYALFQKISSRNVCKKNQGYMTLSEKSTDLDGKLRQTNNLDQSTINSRCDPSEPDSIKSKSENNDKIWFDDEICQRCWLEIYQCEEHSDLSDCEE